MSPHNRRSCLLMLVGSACFVVNATILKLGSQIMPAFELMFIQAISTCVTLAAAAAQGTARAGWRALLSARVTLRSLLDALGMVVYLVGLTRLPLASTSAIYMTTPIFVTLLAMLVLRERVSPAQWIAVFLGFTGVLLVVQPATGDFNAWSFCVLASALLVATRDLITRGIARETPTLVLNVGGLLTLAVCSAIAGGMSESWRMPSALLLALLVGGSALLAASYLLMTIAMREGDLSVTSPLRYVSLIYSALFGFLFWGDLPNVLALSGMALIVGAGLSVLRARPATPVLPTPDPIQLDGPNPPVLSGPCPAAAREAGPGPHAPRR